jgi:hypothetical protein
MLAGRLAAERAAAEGLTRRVIDAGLTQFSP